ncbi:uncharacterized protein LOC119744960 isoform X2 [Patiria miniata]|uniref:RGS domain-containing protein n=1 Tax=Patiria miniata TaxID=46514 RepID=A0A914BN10_PATMI|nr:uncharacterized protein LOC119744960 isoform X2 [Patiria miniata]
MDSDNSETVPKGEVPTEAEFARLLCDKTFVDYFNTFLSLPVFSQRLLYRFTEQNFELDPPIKRTQYRLDRLKLMRWVRTQRAPLFFKTDLYLEFLLCKQLQKTQLHLSCLYGTDQSNAKDRMLDRRLMSRWLSRVSGMRKFRSFLDQTAGEKALNFWLDAERFRKTTHCMEEHRVLFRQIEAKYFKHGGMLELPEHAKWLASVKPGGRDGSSSPLVEPGSRARERRQSHFLGSGVEVESRLPGGSIYGDSHEWLIAPDAFVVIQGFFLKTLQNYWVSRYIIHCKTKWFVRGDVSVYRPNCYVVKVRSLSDLVDEEGEALTGEGIVKSKQLVRVGSRLKKQSAFNLLSMFSSPGVRRSELAAILKLEDTGETLGVKPDAGQSAENTEGWKTEDFPLPTISEESGMSDESRKSSARSKSSSSPGFATPSPCPTSPEKSISVFSLSPEKTPSKDDMKTTGAGLVSIESPDGKKDVISEVSIESPDGKIDVISEVSIESPDGKKDEVQKELPFAEPSESRQGSPLAQDGEGRITPTSAKKRRSSDVTGLSSADTDKLMSRFPPGRMRRSSVAVPYQISRDSSSSSVGRSSVSGDSIHTPSLRRMSLQSNTGLDPSSSSLASSRGSAPAALKKPKPPQRARAKSMEFRLADFSMMIKSLDATGGAAATSGDVSDIDKIASIGLPQLEADIEALQTQKEIDERKKAEKASRRQRRRGSVIEDDQAGLGGKLGKKGHKTGKAYLQRGRRGSNAFRPSGKQLAQLTRANLALMEAAHRGKWKPPSLSSRRSISTREGRKMGFGQHLGKYGLQKDEVERVQEPTKDYNKLTFQEKLEQDSRKLARIPRLSPSQMLGPSGADIEAVGTLAEFTKDSTFSIGSKLPNINSEVHLKQPAAMSICQPSYRGYGLGEVNYRQKHRLLIGAISSDKLAGNPLYNFLQTRHLETELSYLKFWQAAQEYLMTGTYSSDIEGSLSRHRLARQIKATFLTQTGECHISVGDRLASELCGQLPQDTADELVVHAQNLACEALQECLTNFQRHDLEEFLSKTTSRKNFQLDAYSRLKTRPTGFPDQLPSQKGAGADLLPSIETSSHAINQLMKTARESAAAEEDEKRSVKVLGAGTVSALAPYRMWRALQLAESATRAVTEPVVVSDPSDPDSDSEDEGSLRRKLTTVYRKRKPKPVKEVGPRPSFGPSSQRSLGIQRTIQARASKHAPDDEATAMGKAVCRAIRKDGKTIHRPPRPKVFQEVLRDASHQEFLKRFLAQRKSDLPLQFWQAVEGMKTSCRDAKSRQSKTIMIVRKFFSKANDFGNALQCDAEIIQEIPHLEKVTPQMLMSAQACVARSMEENWFGLYQDTFPDEASDEESEEGSTTEEERLGPRDKNKALWAMFINNVTSFRRGLMNQATMAAFKAYFAKEVQREMEKQKQTGVQIRRMISNKVIIVERLKNDLSFWAEVERFKELADSAARAAAMGTYTLDDEEYVQKKAKALIDCYIDSQVPPKLQINIPQEIADEILGTFQNGLIERGLFHDAAVSIFSVLLYCWKKFCRERFAPPSKKSSRAAMSTEPPKKRKRKRKRHPSTPRVAGVKIKTITGTSVDDHPKMQFSLQTGIQLILPPKPPSYDHERLRAMIRQLYPEGGQADSAHSDDNKLLQLYQVAQQLQAQQQQPGQGSYAQRRLSRSIGQHLQMAARNLMPGGHGSY